MQLTVQSLLKNQLLNNAKVIAGNQGLNRKIAGITIMEAPDIADWIKGEELILTSLYTLNTLNPKVQADIIEELHKKNVSAIGFKIRKIEQKIPNILLELGDKYNIPIILIPTEIPFLDIMNPIMAEIFNKQMIKLRHYKEVHNKFTALALNNKDLNTIVNTLAELIKNPVSIYDSKFNCIYSTNSYLSEFNIISETYDITGDVSKDLRYSKQSVVYNKLENKKGNQIVVTVETINNIKIYLVICEEYRSLEELDYITIENATTVISFELVKQFSVSEVEKKFESDLIDDLVNKNIKEFDDLYQRANIIGLDINNKHIICSINISSNDNLDDINKEFKIQNIIYEAINKYLDKSFIRIRSNNITVLCDIDKWIKGNFDYNKEIKTVMTKIKQKVENQIYGSVISIGISNVVNSIVNMNAHYKESNEALELGILMYEKGSITSFDDLGILRLLCKIENKINLMSYIPNELIALSEYDKLNKSNLLNTLEVFLSNSLNASKASKLMYIHYKTIMYRLERIKQITSVEFDDNEKVLELQIGFKILKITNNK